MASYDPVVDPAILNQLEPNSTSPQYSPVDPTTSKFLDQTGAPTIGNTLTSGYMGLRDPIVQAQALAARGVNALAPQGSGASQAMESYLRTLGSSNKEAETGYQEAYQGNPPNFDVARMLGNMVPTTALSFAMPGSGAASLLPRVASGAVSGAASGALQPIDPTSDKFWEQVGQNMIQGGAVGGATTLGVGGAARLINPNAAERAAPLIESGVSPTAGQLLGGTPGRIEEALTSIPLAGDMIKTGRLRAMQQFNRGAINQALAPIGESLDSGTPLGRQAIAEANDKISAAYDKLTPNLGVQADPQFVTDLQRLNQMASFMPADRRAQFANIVQRQIYDNMSPIGGMTGDTFKNVESDLGKFARQYMGGNTTADERQLGGGIRELQATLRGLLTRSNPDAADSLQNVNSAYANFLRVERASAGLGNEEGVFTPAQLLSATKTLAPTTRLFTTGKAMMQPYAEAGKTVLGNKVPDSGTPYRTLAALGGTALLGHGAEATGIGAAAAPYLLGGAAGGAGAMAAYSRPGQWLLARLLAMRPDAAAPIANALKGAAPLGSAAAPYTGNALIP